MTQFVVPDLVEMLSVVDAGARTSSDILTGPPFPTPHGRAFGGQVMGQAIAAAGTTTSADHRVHSMHGYFLRPGVADERMTFEVTPLHDGRSFATRRVQAYQDGREVMAMIASFQVESGGIAHQTPYDMAGITPPDKLPSVWEKYGHLADSGRASWILARPFDFRYVESDTLLKVEEKTGYQRVWMRARDTMPDGDMLHAAALTFASDYVLIEPVLRRHGIPWATPGFKAASLDHAVWFHRPFRVDEWLLYELDTPVASNGRGLTQGRFYNTAGELVATVAQESTVRLPQN